MKATAEKMADNTVVMNVEVDAEQLEKAMDQAYRKMVKKVNVPGFRQGKTPRMVFEKFVGKAFLYNEAVELIIPEAYQEAVLETGIEPVAQPDLELTQVEEGKPVIFKATVRVKPEVILGQYTGLQATKPVINVTDEDVAAELKKLQERHARLDNLEAGVVEQGDIAVIDYVGRKDGVEFDGGAGSDYSLEIGSNTFIPGFEEQLVGAAVGETKVLAVTFPDNYQSEDLKGQPVEFTVTVKSIKRKELLPLDDEFAKDVSEFETLAELEADQRSKLLTVAENEAKHRINNEVVQQAVENAQVDIPEEMIDTRVEEMMDNMSRRMMQQGLTMENYFAYTNTNPDEMRKSLREDAARGVKTSLVLEAIVAAEGIKLAEGELDQEIQEMSKMYQQEPDVLRKILEGQNQLAFIQDGLQQQKAIEFMADRAELVDAPPPSPDDTAAESAE